MHTLKHQGLVVLIALAACGGQSADKQKPPTSIQIAGSVFKGAVAQGTVTAYALDTSLNRGAVLSTATTDTDGTFALSLPSTATGAALIVASSGTYTEESVGLSQVLGGHELTALVPDVTAAGAVVITPVSTWAAALATYHVNKKSEPLASALSDAYTHLNAHFGGLDWRTVTPADATAGGISSVSPNVTAGVILAGLSYEARLLAEAAKSTVSPNINGATLSEAIAFDIADGTLDGKGSAGQITQAGSKLDGLATRSSLATAIGAFLASDRNASALAASSFATLSSSLASDNDPYLFCPGQVASASCTTGPQDTTPPTIIWSSPADGSSIRGATTVLVAATDHGSGVKSFAFTAPPALVATAASISSDGTTATLQATLDVSALPDGALQIGVSASDNAQNVATSSINVTVSNQGPLISVSTPGDGSVVQGTVLVSATASSASAGASIASLSVSSPPAGMGSNQATTPDVFSASWDTSKVPNGVVSLSFHAVDSNNKATDLTVTVTVANHGPSLNASAPADGSTVKGTIAVSAKASTDTAGASITALSLVSPPAGMGSNQATTPDAFSASWDTTKVANGPVTLSFHAVDSYNQTVDQTISVTVANPDTIPPTIAWKVTFTTADAGTFAPVVIASPSIGADGGASPTLDAGVIFDAALSSDASATVDASESADDSGNADGGPGAPTTINLVAGTIDLDVSAADSDGVASLTVQANGMAIPPGSASTDTHFVASYTPASDGPITFQATATDTLSNQASSTYSVRVDNTPPTVTQTAPAAATYYSANVPVDISAEDDYGLSSFTVSGLTGFADTSTDPTHVEGTWAIPATMPDGSATLNVAACDLVYNCVATSAAVQIDRTAPDIRITVPPPGTTSQSTVNIQFTVTDSGSGVGTVGVTVQVAGSTSPPGSVPVTAAGGGVYTATITANPSLSTEVQFLVTIHASDNAVPANSNKTTNRRLAEPQASVCRAAVVVRLSQTSG